MLIEKSIGVVLINYHQTEETSELANYYATIKCIDQIVIVNNEADNESINFFNERSIKKTFIINSNSNLGYSKGNNLGIKYLLEKKCDYIIISNSDVYIQEDDLEKTVRKMIQYPDFGILAPRMINADETVVNPHVGDLNYKTLFNRLFLREKQRDKHWEKKIIKRDNIIMQNFVPGSFFVVSAEAISKCEYFDENIFLYREEEILGKRMEKAGFEIGLLEDAFFHHNHHYRKETAKKKLYALKIALKSEKYYFRVYKKANKFQMLYVSIFQGIYQSLLYINWKIKEKKI